MVNMSSVADAMPVGSPGEAVAGSPPARYVIDIRPVRSRIGELLAVLAMLVAVASVGAFVVV